MGRLGDLARADEKKRKQTQQTQQNTTTTAPKTTNPETKSRRLGELARQDAAVSPITMAVQAANKRVADTMAKVKGQDDQAQAEAKRRTSAITPTAITYQERKQAKDASLYDATLSARDPIDVIMKRIVPLRREIADLDQDISFYDTEVAKEDRTSPYSRVRATRGDYDTLVARRAQLQARADQLTHYVTYERLRNNPDFAEKSKPDPEMLKKIATVQSQDWYKDDVYAAVNGIEGAADTLKKYRDVPADIVSMYNYIYATQGNQAAREYLDAVDVGEYTELAALAAGLGKGSGLMGLEDILTGGESTDRNEQLVARASRDHPVAFGVGNVGGSIAEMVGAKKLFGMIPGVGPVGSTALATGSNTALQNASPLMAGDMSPGDYLLSVGGSTAGGAVGGKVAQGVTGLGTKALFKTGLQNNIFANAINQGVGGAAYSVSSLGTRAVIDPTYNPSAEELAQDAAVSFAFQTITSAVSLHAQSAQAKATLEQEAALLKRDFDTLSRLSKAGIITPTDTIDALKARSALLRNTLNTTQYVGQGEEVKAALTFLDQLDDAVAAAEHGLYSTMLGSATPAPGAAGTAGAGAFPSGLPTLSTGGSLAPVGAVGPAVESVAGQIPTLAASGVKTLPAPDLASTGQKTGNVEVPASDPLKVALFGSGQEKTASTGEAAGTVHVGQATVIQRPYTGATPDSDPSASRIVPSVQEKSVKTAQDRIADAGFKAAVTGRSARKFLTMAYESLFPQRRDIPVSGLTMDGEPYVVSIHKSAIGKVISDKNMTPEKLAVLDVLDDIVKNGKYVGSGEYVPTEGGKVKTTIRFDYFETPATIDGKPFLVTFDVEVFPGHNNYRTHKVINEMDLVPLPSGEVGTDQPQSLEGRDPSGDSIPQTPPGVNPETDGTPGTTGGPVGVGAAEKGFAARQAAAKTATSRVGTNQFPYNQRRGVAAGMTREEYTAAFRYSVLHEEDSMRTARGLVYHPEDGVDVFLLDYDPEGFAELVASLEDATAWNAPQQDAAHLIERELFGRSLNGEITEAQYADFLRIMREKNTAGGQGIQANAKWTRTDNDHGEQTRAEAWELLQKADMTDEERQARFAAIVKFDARIEDAKTDEELRAVILDIARERGTLSRWLDGKEAKTLVAAAQWGVGAMDTAELRQFAYASSAALTTDVNRADLGQKVRTIQVLNMLSSPKTPARNITGNTTFYALDALTMNVASILDAAIGKISGTQSMAWEKGLIRNKAKRDALTKAIRLSLAEVTMDVDMGSGNRYAGGKRTFKADGALPERVMSVLERNMGYLMTVPDELYKGMSRSQAGALQAKIDKGKIKTENPDYAAEQADDLALYRTFQKDGVLAGALQTVHDWLNIVGVGNSGKTVGKGGHKVHSFGLGDLTAPFTRVAGNLVQVGIDYNPVKAAQGVVELTKVVADAVRKRSVDPKAQAKAVSDTTRGLTGTALAIGVAMLASAGLVKRADDEGNKKVADMNKANGMTGTQINLTAAQRALDGGSTQWQAGDTLVDLSSIEPLNLIVDLGVEFANMEDYDESDGVLSTFGAPGKVLQASVNSTVHAAADLPVLDTVSDFAKDVTLYGENPVDAFASAIAKSAVSSVTPNFMASAAKGMDDKQRNLYAEKGFGPELWAYILSRTPGARETLPVKEDPATGEEKENPGNLIQRLARAMVLPVGVNTYQGQNFGGMSAEDWGRMFAQVDADKNKSVSKAETMAWIEENVPKEQWHEVFETYKGNRNWKNPY